MITNSPDVLIISGETSIGIEEVRQVQSFLSRKPSQSENNTVYIKDAHLLTIPAQNALLKTLEEPPGKSLIYLVTASPDALLPTVLSRVQIIKPEDQTSVEADTANVEKIMTRLKTLKIGERLALVDAQNFTRESALEFLTELEHYLHKNISNFQLSTIHYQLIHTTRQYLKANVNVKLIMDNLFLHILPWLVTPNSVYFR